jgi:hypothetical protein
VAIGPMAQLHVALSGAGQLIDDLIDSHSNEA